MTNARQPSPGGQPHAVRPRRAAAVLGAFGLALLLGACGTPRDFTVYQQTIGDFQTATDRTASVALEAIQGINSFERDYELKLLREDPRRPLDVARLDTPVLSTAAIDARDRTFRVLKQYTQMLAALADSDASERWKAASQRAKAAADALIENIGQQSATLAQLPIAEATTPLQAISDAVATEIINARRAAALDAAIAKAAPAIQDISALLREDLAFVVRQRDSVKLLEIAELSIAYGQAQIDGNNAARLRLLGDIDTAVRARSRDLATMQGLMQSLDQFDAAHDALVRYAVSDKGPQELSDLVAIVQSYAATAEQVFESFRAIREGTS
ncbi:MAG: hypothetical protein ACFCUW_16335 [Kiloniellaceae bacterium]